MRNLIIISIMLFVPVFLFGQHKKYTSTEVVDPEKYTSPTKWSPIDKHYGYYIAAFSMPVSMDSRAERSINSGYLKLGYTYRYKLVNFMDIGFDLSYANRYSRIAINEFDESTIQPYLLGDSRKIKTYHNYAEAGAFVRFNLGGATYRKLGTYIDIGGFFDYAMGYGVKTKMKLGYKKYKIKEKRPYYLSPENYGIYMRVGWNYISLFCSYQFGDWITNYSSGTLIKDYNRSPLTLGIQLNLYSR